MNVGVYTGPVRYLQKDLGLTLEKKRFLPQNKKGVTKVKLQ